MCNYEQEQALRGLSIIRDSLKLAARQHALGIIDSGALRAELGSRSAHLHGCLLVLTGGALETALHLCDMVRVLYTRTGR